MVDDTHHEAFGAMMYGREQEVTKFSGKVSDCSSITFHFATGREIMFDGDDGTIKIVGWNTMDEATKAFLEMLVEKFPDWVKGIQFKAIQEAAKDISDI